MKTILVTGGTGYIGSVTATVLLDKGYNVIVVDNLSMGNREFVDKRAKFYWADITTRQSIEYIFKENNIDAVMHFASYKSVEESMNNPIKYMDNITGVIVLLQLMKKYQVPKIVFSSSASVYGIPKTKLVTEESPTNPINFYGYTKLIGEQLIKESKVDYGILRYFNVVGMTRLDKSKDNILPIFKEYRDGIRKEVKIFGDDYDTPDGTCVRDYIHVLDLADAHILSLECKENHTVNIGTGKGISVIELFDIFDVPRIMGERRVGDPPYLVASNKKAKELLKWTPSRSITKDILGE